MNKDNIISLPHPSLREKSRKVKEITPEIEQLAIDMSAATLDWEATRDHEVGVALAAVQVDVHERVVIIREDHEEKSNDNFVVLVNPKIVQTSGRMITEPEGCLSVRNVYGKVPRHEKVKVRALDLDGNEITVKAEGFLARILQHEIDHTNGILFVDHIRDNEDAFFELQEKGGLKKLDYQKDIAGNTDLWQDED